MSNKEKLGRNRKDSNDDMVNLVDNIERQNDLKYNRRSFLKTAVAASVTLGVATLPFSIKAMLNDGEEEQVKVKIAKLSDVAKGESINFNYPTDQEPAILVHTKDGELKAYNNKCTHLQCPVFYEKEQDILLCPCHRGFFDVKSGHPVAGPPQRELPLIQTEVINDVIYAVGRKIRHG
ncbi:Rieske 2Fe-2S domain-containing protein [Litchfieldia salsa]|uniref:Ferredoxin subunit of nitrite reductase or a ring-hydroxylating dioxygenase n=1 Tax=Litchfieldia salsa TaxID=930152 RepID=A0A1H0TDS8_9BACI|nr:Rieske 2Fe-2S domain-containing protein [Litchfieldia salsa]SDP52164.1 Ferredoxin subunit of nitrite reductase or a ring-hydroxylating dioxygenase [Litchfieldia salsa]